MSAMRPRGTTFAAIAAALLAAGCGGSDDSPRAVVSATPLPTVVSATEMNLLTHCGIRWARIGDDQYVAAPALDDGNGNPPAGWANPSHNGTFTVYSDGSARFDDGHGQVATFRPKTSTDEQFLCA